MSLNLNSKLGPICKGLSQVLSCGTPGSRKMRSHAWPEYSAFLYNGVSALAFKCAFFIQYWGPIIPCVQWSGKKESIRGVHNPRDTGQLPSWTLLLYFPVAWDESGASSHKSFGTVHALEHCLCPWPFLSFWSRLQCLRFLIFYSS